MNYNQMGILLGLSAVLIIWLVRHKINNPYARSIWKAALLVFLLYALILITVEIRWYFITVHAKSFDLNGNGFVDLDEYSDEAIEAMNRVTQDSARTFAVITVAILSSMVSFAYLLADITVTYIKINKSNNRT